MEKYKLKEDEVVLYKGNVNVGGKNNSLTLTNLNIVFILDDIDLNEENNIEIYSVESIKIYQEIPQVKVYKKIY